MRGVALEATAATGQPAMPVAIACEERDTLFRPDGLSRRQLVRYLDFASETGGDLATWNADYFAALLMAGATKAECAALWAGDQIPLEDGWSFSYIPMLRLWLYHAGRKRSIRIIDAQRWGKETLEATGRLYGVATPPAGRRWHLTADSARTYAEQAAAAAGGIARAIDDAFRRAGLPRHWRDGTGRVAGALLDRLTTPAAFGAPPIMLEGAIETGYFGGRVSLSQFGRFDHVTQLDIRSAYPSALALLPTLAGARWIKATHYRPDEPHALWFARWQLPKGAAIGPLPVRVGGRVTYPLAGSGYYWANEARAALELFPECVTITHGAFLRLATDERPLAGLVDYYARRRLLSGDGDDAAAHVLKLSLNACYGRLAQVMRPNGRPGRWASLAAAGMVTSNIRARMLRLFCDHYERGIAIATDSLTLEGGTSCAPSTELGGFAIAGGDDAILLPSGAFHVAGGAAAMDRVAGTSRHAQEEINWDHVRAGWDIGGMTIAYPVAVPYFVGVGLAANGRYPDFGRWRVVKHDIVGRVHDGSPKRADRSSYQKWRVLPSPGGRMSDRYVPKCGAVARRADQALLDALSALTEQGTPD